MSPGLVQKCGKCERTAPTRLPRGKVSRGSGQIRGTKPTAMSKSKCAKSCALRSPPPPPPPPPPTKGGERREDGGGEKKFSTILGKATSLFCMCTVLSPRSCLRGTPGSRVGGPVSHDWTFPAFKFGRGLLVLVLVEAKSTARQQNFFRSPMPLPNFRDRLWRPGPCKGEVNGAPAKLFSVPGASVKILLSCAQSLRSPVPLSKFCSPVRSLFGPRCLCQNFALLCAWPAGPCPS